MYDQFKLKLNVTWEYIQSMLEKSFITFLKSFFSVLVFYVKKKDSGLHFCVDYQDLNKITLKNKHLLPLIRTLFDLLMGAWWFTKLDFIAVYYALYIRADNK